MFKKDTKLGNRRGENTRDPIDFKKVIKEYYQQLYASKFANLDKMDTFPQKTRYQSSLKKK